MMRFSANLGFLWTELPLLDAVRAAKNAGFDAVECHWPYQVPAVELRAVLGETNLPILGLNTVRGAAGENGLSALVGREHEAHAAIDQALDYAAVVGAPNVHVMAGFAIGKAAHETFLANLSYATMRAAIHNITILIEPLNHYDAPDYFLSTSDQASEIIAEVGAPNLKLMFDCYHIQIMEGDVTRRLEKLLPIIGHIQIASVPHRQEPDRGELNYPYIYKHLAALGYQGALGAEYRPQMTTENGLGWLAVAKAQCA